jgi:hypothetical protein
MKSTPPGNIDLAGALDALRQAEKRVQAPPHVEMAVLAAWDRAHVSPPGIFAKTYWTRAGAVAATMAIVVGLGQLGRHLRESTRVTAQPVADNRTLLVVGEPILQGEPVRIVRMRVPASTLTGLGVRTAADVAHVDVDVIIGEDGVARAIRLGM